jgi:hypothetical protein
MTQNSVFYICHGDVMGSSFEQSEHVLVDPARGGLEPLTTSRSDRAIRPHVPSWWDHQLGTPEISGDLVHGEDEWA